MRASATYKHVDQEGTTAREEEVSVRMHMYSIYPPYRLSPHSRIAHMCKASRKQRPHSALPEVVLGTKKVPNHERIQPRISLEAIRLLRVVPYGKDERVERHDGVEDPLGRLAVQPTNVGSQEVATGGAAGQSVAATRPLWQRAMRGSK